MTSGESSPTTHSADYTHQRPPSHLGVVTPKCEGGLWSKNLSQRELNDYQILNQENLPIESRCGGN